MQACQKVVACPGSSLIDDSSLMQAFLQCSELPLDGCRQFAIAGMPAWPLHSMLLCVRLHLCKGSHTGLGYWWDHKAPAMQE